jgi:GNAT superfamily N-acetyltransferase
MSIDRQRERAVASIELRRETVTSPAALALIGALNAELTALYPEPGANHFRLDPEEVAEGRGAFLVAHGSDGPIGCGAIRLLDPRTVEVKRMYVAPRARGLGVGRLILGELERQGRLLGAERIVLETGTRQTEALALYESAGFARIDPWGEYTATATTSVCMAKRLH